MVVVVAVVVVVGNSRHDQGLIHYVPSMQMESDRSGIRTHAPRGEQHLKLPS